MDAEFEEKTYEQHLTSALVYSKGLFFPPGQVLEEVLGFDVALRTSNRQFWRHFRHLWPWWRRWPWTYHRGLEMDPSWWDELEEEIEYFPKFKFNCFIQAKRPQRMVRSDAAEYSHWNQNYFRYEMFQSQQTALSRLATLTQGRALVVCACPAFHTYRELWHSINSGSLIRRSNFCEAQRLDGHKRYSFIAAGNRGVAHSDPQEVESIPFESALEALGTGELSEADSNLNFLLHIGKVLDEASEGLGELRPTYKSIVDAMFPEVEHKIAGTLARIYAFQFVTNTRMFIGSAGLQKVTSDIKGSETY